MKRYRLRKIGTMRYYKGSCNGRVLTSPTGKLYLHRGHLTNSIKCVPGFRKDEWELQVLEYKVTRVERYDGQGYGMEMPDEADRERAQKKLKELYPHGYIHEGS